MAIRTGGVSVSVKALRLGFLNLLHDQTDSRFTGRLMHMVKEINRRDFEGLPRQKSVLFSCERPYLSTLKFNIRERIVERICHHFRCSHLASRIEASLSLSDLYLYGDYIPRGASHFRLLNHLSIISDYTYNPTNQSYEPRDPMNTLSAFAYSEYLPIEKTITVDVKAAFPAGTLITEDASVIQCVGIEFYMITGCDVYLPMARGSVMVADIF